jgi:hypothetical protein
MFTIADKIRAIIAVSDFAALASSGAASVAMKTRVRLIFLTACLVAVTALLVATPMAQAFGFNQLAR